MGPGLVGGGVKVAPPSRLRERGVAGDGQMPGGGQAERRPPQLVSRRFIRCLSEPPGERSEVRRPVRPAGAPLVKQAARVDERLIAVTAACRGSLACDRCPASREVNQSSRPRHRFRHASSACFSSWAQRRCRVRPPGGRVGDRQQSLVTRGFQVT
jgi:hypothetical protein